MRIPFGKYCGCEINRLPDNYLQWLKTIPLRDPISTAVDCELKIRQLPAEIMRQTANEIISSGRRTLANKFHPDKGGDSEKMQILNNTADWLYHLVID